MSDKTSEQISPIVAEGVDEEPIVGNARQFSGKVLIGASILSAFYAAFHMAALNGLSIRDWTGLTIPLLPRFPMETWNFRIVHVAGALVLGFMLFASARFADSDGEIIKPNPLVRALSWLLLLPALFSVGVAAWFGTLIEGGVMWNGMDATLKSREIYLFGIPLLVATVGAIVLSWVERLPRHMFSVTDLVLGICGIAVATYLIVIYGTLMRNSTGTPFAPIGISIAALAGTLLILELTRRVAGLALVIISVVFLVYVFTGQYLPGFLNSPAISWERFFSQVYTDAGILGATTAVSSTYIILFIIFAAFLSASKVGDYFVNFAFATAGRARGGPAKVSIFASGLMGMINGTSAGNVVATGSLTIPLMKKVGYDKKTAGAVEAAASTGGQIMPPIMGAGAFIMAEITGIPYQEIAIAAIIPAVLYFACVYMMVDFEAAKLGMRGMRKDELPKLPDLLKKVFLFLPIIILIVALFQGYSVIRAGTLATISAAVVSWLTPYRMDLKAIYKAFENAGQMSIQIIVVCACAGIIVGLSAPSTGLVHVLQLSDAAPAQPRSLLGLFFAMCIPQFLAGAWGIADNGSPMTCGGRSVRRPGLVNLGIPQLTAHFFVFYYAVLSAITPPVALASFAAAGISGANPMETSVTSFKIGLAAFVVPFMFFYNGALLDAGNMAGSGTCFRHCVAGCVSAGRCGAGLVVRQGKPDFCGWSSGSGRLP